ncbi:hypothetical protein [Spongiactinospora sp. TRM90649]|uniref:hypothetical protein n=1 Tax=Spongiactinospora sp. TRM90649 TaxID=3031114 RepID=UPI0023F7766F|nr:hypothetical protein [Spongiactinospora sp. TRM90649]MDF5755883.1 hypothetical protein [Spongiactinospora sp. TRM90649]
MITGETTTMTRSVEGRSLVAGFAQASGPGAARATCGKSPRGTEAGGASTVWGTIVVGRPPGSTSWTIRSAAEGPGRRTRITRRAPRIGVTCSGTRITRRHGDHDWQTGAIGRRDVRG